jgi:hypothetical protein
MIKPDIKAGFTIDSARYSFKQMATRFDLGHGYLWLLKITSPTSAGIAVDFEKFNLPEGASLGSYRIHQTGVFTSKPKMFTKCNFEDYRFSSYADGKELYIELYEPISSVSETFDIYIERIGYFFTDGRRVAMPEAPKKKDEPLLKSGGWGFSSNAFNCSTTLPCSGTEEWRSTGKSVVYIRVRLSNFSVLPGTGFFINKSNGYSITEKPYIITAGHLFAPNNIDKRSSIAETFLYVNYEDQDCKEDFERRGVYAGGFDIVSIGSSFNVDAQSSSYVHNEDFALLKSENTVSQLAVYNVLYAGWDRSFSYNGSSGYAYIGHPMDDVKTVNTYNGNGQVNSLGDYFKIYNSTGICERGFSGSPVFWGSPGLGNVKAVGWALSTESAVACGDEKQVTRCGMFSNLFWNTDIQNSLNPDMKYSESSSQPTTEALPDHCTNCIEDGDETGVDCGGSCQPCGMADELVINDKADIFDRSGQSEINARFALSVEGGAGQLDFADNDYVLTSGETVSLKSFKVSTGATFKAQVVPSQRYEPFQGCQPACVDMPNYFTPNDDGINDYFAGLFAFVESYDIQINSNNGTLAYQDFNVPVYDNGGIILWDGDGSTNGSVYYVTLTITDCYGEETVYTQNLSCFKSAYVENSETSIKEVEVKENIMLYPNPADNVLKIYVNKSLSRESYNVSVFDINGKKIKETTMGGTQNNLDISNMHPGSYILRMSTKEKTFTKCFLKK